MSTAAIRSIARTLGIDIVRYSEKSDPDKSFCRMLNDHGIDLVFDVGANRGQFGRLLRRGGFAGRIVSFEPLAAAHADLVKAAAGDPNWIVAERCAVGAADGEIEINVSANSVSSSVLPITATTTTAYPQSAYVGAEMTPLRRLDGLAGPHLAAAKAPFLKLDTQGYEWAVLDGATDALAAAKGVLCEMSFVPLYQDQPLWRDIIARLEGLGFVLWALSPPSVDAASGRSLWTDGTFFRGV